MHVQVNDQITINAPASKVWRILAHEFENIGQWSSGITESRATTASSVPEGAMVGGRVCLSPGIGGDVAEEFTYYDEQDKRFGYQAMGELPWFLNRAGNNWSVHALDANQAIVAFKGEVDVKLFPGLLMLPFLPILKKVLGTRTLEELKYYIEHDQPHPRKLKAQQKHLKQASVGTKLIDNG